MEIAAAETKGADGGPTGMYAAHPGADFGINVKWTFAGSYRFVGPFVV